MREFEQFNPPVEQIVRALSDPTGAEPYLLLAVVVVALLISIFLRDLPTLLAASLFAAATTVSILVPELNAISLGTATASSALLIAIVSVLARRREMMIQRRLEDAESQLLRLRTDVEAIFLRQLKVAQYRRRQKATAEASAHASEDKADVRLPIPTPPPRAETALQLK
jgi:hypothetical protein